MVWPFFKQIRSRRASINLEAFHSRRVLSSICFSHASHARAFKTWLLRSYRSISFLYVSGRKIPNLFYAADNQSHCCSDLTSQWGLVSSKRRCHMYSTETGSFVSKFLIKIGHSRFYFRFRLGKNANFLYVRNKSLELGKYSIWQRRLSPKRLPPHLKKVFRLCARRDVLGFKITLRTKTVVKYIFKGASLNLTARATNPENVWWGC